MQALTDLRFKGAVQKSRFLRDIRNHYRHAGTHDLANHPLPQPITPPFYF
ncbi:hypothetical protein GGI1_14623, partial [Acidithiobacillus sp. GGI-221]